MTLRFAAAAALLALAGLAAPARAEPNCEVKVMGLTIDQCTADRTVFARSPAYEVLPQSADTVPNTSYTTGRVDRRPVTR